MTQDTKKQFEKELIQYGLKNNYIEKEKDGTLKFVGSKKPKYFISFMVGDRGRRSIYMD